MFTAATGLTVTTQFAYDGPNAWADLDANGSLITRRIFGDGEDQVIARITASTGDLAWYLTDRLGSVRQMTDNLGVVQYQATYGAFGDLQTAVGASFGDRYQFVSREYDAATGLYYYRARYYDPSTGRFTGEDPAGLGVGDTNLNRYVRNDPTNLIDPSGRVAESDYSGSMWNPDDRPPCNGMGNEEGVPVLPILPVFPEPPGALVVPMPPGEFFLPGQVSETGVPVPAGELPGDWQWPTVPSLGLRLPSGSLPTLGRIAWNGFRTWMVDRVSRGLRLVTSGLSVLSALSVQLSFRAARLAWNFFKGFIELPRMLPDFLVIGTGLFMQHVWGSDPEWVADKVEESLMSDTFSSYFRGLRIVRSAGYNGLTGQAAVDAYQNDASKKAVASIMSFGLIPLYEAIQEGDADQVAYIAGAFTFGFGLGRALRGAKGAPIRESGIEPPQGTSEMPVEQARPMPEPPPAKLSIPVPKGHTRVYRFVSEAEYQQIMRTGKFEQGPNSLEGKWFMDSLESVKRLGDKLEGPGNYRVIEADVPDDAPSLHKSPNVDRQGPGRYLDLNDLKDVKPRSAEQ